MPDYDAIVIGSGPAGAAAAIVLAREGANVLLADKSAFPRPKLCGGLLTQKSVALLADLLAASEEELKQAGVIGRTSDRYLVLDRTNGRLGGGRSRVPFRFADRNVLDLALREQALRLGATALEDRAVACDAAAGTVRFASGRESRGRMIIGADGVNSVVRRAMPVEKRTWSRGMAGAIEIRLDPTQVGNLPGRPMDFPVLYGGFVRSGYGWLFPSASGEKLIAGICALPSKGLDLRRSFLDMLAYLGVASPETILLKGHPLPYGNYLRRPAHGRALLAGDAAGFADPLLGEGIAYALASGRLAGQAALRTGFDPARAASAYVRSLEAALLRELRWCSPFRALVFACLNRDVAAPVKAMFALADGPLLEMVHGLRSFKFLLPLPAEGLNG